MVRESTTKSGCYALSLRVPREYHPRGIAHYLIIRTGKGYKIKVSNRENPLHLLPMKGLCGIWNCPVRWGKKLKWDRTVNSKASLDHYTRISRSGYTMNNISYETGKTSIYSKKASGLSELYAWCWMLKPYTVWSVYISQKKILQKKFYKSKKDTVQILLLNANNGKL